MARYIGTVSRGVRAPIIRQGDDIVEIVVQSVLRAAESERIAFRDKDVISVTEAVVARAQGNYASVNQVAQDIRQKFPSGVLGVVFPILSRNRFAVNLRGIARGAKKIYLQLSYPSDEVGNRLISADDLDKSKINPWTDVLDEAMYRRIFGDNLHPFTGVDYVSYYKEVIEKEGCEVEFIFANDPRVILGHCPDVLTCDIHTRKYNLRLLQEAGAGIVYNIESILSEPIDGSGYNPSFGMLGSNKSTEETLKLFPRDCEAVVEGIARRLSEISGCQIEAMIYGDGAFRDPVGQIWELADPVVSPAYTAGLEGVPNEVKLKYLADNDFAGLSGEELNEAVVDYIHDKSLKQTGIGQMVSQGTTPRRITDLLGSLSDLTSGSGDKGTPIVWIQGYFDDLSQ
ncbi:MAG: F420-0--gamma-glutamyl ligase [Clostridia bacterium]|nr:F420-0--gamma-glutamyl ligase [Clostridia bacterium]